MLISRKLAQKVIDRLQVVVCLIEERKFLAAIKEIQELAGLINRSLETKEEEKARMEREKQ